MVRNAYLIGAVLAALPLNAVAQSTDLTGLAGGPRLSFAPQVTQGPASDLDPEYLSPAPSLDPDALSKQLSNPNSPLSKLVFKHTYMQFDGTLPEASDQSSNVTLFQPIFPFPIGDGTNLFIRPAIANVWDQPVFDPNSGDWDSVSDWADVGFDIAVGKSFDGGWVAVGGVQGTIPTYSDVSGEQWRLGPEALVANIGEKAYWALFPSHQWDIGGDYDYSTSGLEIVAGYYLPNAWTIYSDSQLTYDWVADKATVPVNLTLRKVTKIGNTPIQFNLGVDSGCCIAAVAERSFACLRHIPVMKEVSIETWRSHRVFLGARSGHFRECQSTDCARANRCRERRVLGA